MRLSICAGADAVVSTDSRDPPPCRLSSPRPDVKASKEELRAASRLFVSTESADWLVLARGLNVVSQSAAMVEPNPLKNDSTSTGDALPLVTARRRVSNCVYSVGKGLSGLNP